MNGLETLLKHEGAVVLAALLVLTLLAWLALLAGAGTGMNPAAMSGWWVPMELPPAESWSWTPYYWLIAFFMWAVMMVAMMLPSASPLVLLYARVMRQAESQGRKVDAPASIAAFASGYLTLWILFSAFAVALQFGLERSGLMSAMMASRSVALSGALLIAAGVYQLSPAQGRLPQALPRARRVPRRSLASRRGIGAWRMGLLHGAYCVGCCAVLMLLLFVGGVMNLVWIAGLTLFVALEKFAPFGVATTKVTAAILIAAGLLLIFA